MTSGAEEWVLKGTGSDIGYPPPPNHSHEKTSSEASVGGDENERLGSGEADRHFVDIGPAWRSKLPPFRVLVHSPSKRSSMLSGAYTVYSVTSLFNPSNESNIDPASKPTTHEDTEFITPTSPARITVHRRFSHFVVLHTALSRRLPGVTLPPLPEKQYTGRFSTEFVEARRSDLERYIDRIVRHPVARYAEVMMFFLGCESDLVRPLGNRHQLWSSKAAFFFRNGNGNFPTICLYLLRDHLSMPKFTIRHSISMLMMRQRLENDLITTSKR